MVGRGPQDNKTKERNVLNSTMMIIFDSAILLYVLFYVYVIGLGSVDV